MHRCTWKFKNDERKFAMLTTDYSDLFDGIKSGGLQRVLSWQADQPVSSFNIDILPFLRILKDNGFVPHDHYLGLAEFGTETFYSPGNITFMASDYGMNLSSNGTSSSGPRGWGWGGGAAEGE